MNDDIQSRAKVISFNEHVSPEVQLGNALRRLNAALAQQKAAVAAWRENLAGLAVSLEGLRRTVGAYCDTLDMVKCDMKKQGGDARELMRIMHDAEEHWSIPA
jgi:hypothetical protein